MHATRMASASQTSLRVETTVESRLYLLDALEGIGEPEETPTRRRGAGLDEDPAAARVLPDRDALPEKASRSNDRGLGTWETSIRCCSRPLAQDKGFERRCGGQGGVKCDRLCNKDSKWRGDKLLVQSPHVRSQRNQGVGEGTEVGAQIAQ